MRRERARTAIVLAVLLCAALLSASCEAPFSFLVGSASDTWTRSYPLNAGGDVVVENVDGPIDVQGTDGDKVEVTADRTVRASTADEARTALKSLVIREDVTADRVSLGEDNPPGDVRVAIAFHVKVPKTAGVRLTTTNGGLTVIRLAGAASLQTTNGRIDGRALSGPVRAQTTNGSIAIEFDQIAVSTEPMTLQTGNGSISVAVPRTAKVDLSARCGRGSIDVSPQLPIQMDVQAPRRFEGRVNSGGTRLLMQTDNGTIHITPRS